MIEKELDLAVLDALNLLDAYDVLIKETTFLETFRLNKGLH